jgi:hypothetical protein
MSEIRRGSAAIQEAAKSSGKGEFRPFLPSIYWKDDQEEHYILFLNEIEDTPLFDMIQYIPVEIGDKTVYQETVSKTDQFFGERSDAFEKDWDATARKTNVAIAVELEPVVEVVNKRRKPRGFEVKTVEYERRIFDDDDEATDETEEVTAPAVGYVAQSPNNFFNQISNYDANEAPVTETALKVTRIGKDKTTVYQIVGYDELPIDLTNLVGYVDGISYLGDDLDPLLDEIEKLTPEEAALAIGKKLLDKREEELIDDDRYQELLDGVTESMDKFGNKKKSKKKEKDPPRSRAASRRTTREERVTREETEEPTDESGDEPDEPASDPEATEEVKPTRKAKAKKAASAKQTPESRMVELRAKAAERAKARK